MFPSGKEIKKNNRFSREQSGRQEIVFRVNGVKVWINIHQVLGIYFTTRNAEPLMKPNLKKINIQCNRLQKFCIFS